MSIITTHFKKEYSKKWFSFILQHQKEIDWEYLSANSNLTIEIIKEHLDKPWDLNEIALNPNITKEELLENSHIYPFTNMNYHLKEQQVGTDYEHNWNWLTLTKDSHLKITTELNLDEFNNNNNNNNNNSSIIKFIKNKPDLNWNWAYLSSNLHIEDIMDNPNLNWRWEFVSSNPSVTMKIIKNNPNIRWHWRYLCDNTNLTMDFILEHINKPLDWKFISCNPNITIENITNYSDKILNNLQYPNEIYKERYWDFESICNNDFTTDRTNYVNGNVKKILVTSLLQSTVIQTYGKVKNYYSILFGKNIVKKIITY